MRDVEKSDGEALRNLISKAPRRHRPVLEARLGDARREWQQTIPQEINDTLGAMGARGTGASGFALQACWKVAATGITSFERVVMDSCFKTGVRDVECLVAFLVEEEERLLRRILDDLNAIPAASTTSDLWALVGGPAVVSPTRLRDKVRSGRHEFDRQIGNGLQRVTWRLLDREWVGGIVVLYLVAAALAQTWQWAVGIASAVGAFVEKQ